MSHGLLLLGSNSAPAFIKSKNHYGGKNVLHCSNSQSFGLACHILTQGSNLPVACLSALYTECLLHPLARLVRSSVLKSLLSIETISVQNMVRRTGKSRSEFEGENMKNMFTHYLAELIGSAIKHLKWINLV